MLATKAEKAILPYPQATLEVYYHEASLALMEAYDRNPQRFIHELPLRKRVWGQISKVVGRQ